MSRRARASKRGSQSGQAFLLAVFLVASILLFVAAATPSVLNQGRRERDEEAVWRGKQYERAIRLYQAKNGMLPQTLEDLSKPNAANVHFLRKAYTDPNNHVDGKWRSIYVSGSGQLVGSVRYHNLQEMTLAQQGLLQSVPGAVGFGAQQANQPNGQPNGQQSQQSGFGGQSGFGPQGGTQSGLSQTASGFSASSAQPTSLVPLAPVDGPVIGANLIGVGGKPKVSSVVVYEGGKTYQQWEFIFNPLAGAGAAGAPAAAPAANPAGSAAPGASGGNQSGTGSNAPSTTPSPVSSPTPPPSGGSTNGPIIDNPPN